LNPSSDFLVFVKVCFHKFTTCAATPRLAGELPGGHERGAAGDDGDALPPPVGLNQVDPYPITYNLSNPSSEKTGFKVCLSNATCSATPRLTRVVVAPDGSGAIEPAPREKHKVDFDRAVFKSEYF
jgi:hypothetical protein